MELADFISLFAHFWTMVLNGILIYLTAYHTVRISTTYRHMIIGFALIGIIFSTFDVIVRPIMHSYNGCFLYFSLEGAFRYSKQITEVLLAIYSAIYSIILSFLTVQYVFRTCLLVRPHWVQLFSGWKCIFWLGYVLFLGFAWGFITYVHAYPDEYARDYVRDELFEQYGVRSEAVPLFVLLAYGDVNGEKQVRPQSLICIFGDMGIITLQYTIMLTCGFIMYNKISSDLKEASSLTSTTHSQVQKQFFRALMYQLLAPSLLVHVPAVPLFFAPFFDMKFSFRTRIVVYFFSFYPLFDSLILFSIVSDYKMAIKKVIFNRATQVAAMFSVPSVAPATVTTRGNGNAGNLFHSYNGSAIYFTLGSSFRKDKKMAEMGLLVYAAGYAVISAFLAVQFMYRACLITRPSFAKKFDSWRLVLWGFYSLAIGCFWGYAVIIMYPDDDSYNYVRDEMVANYGVEIRSVPCYIVLAYNGEGDEKSVRWVSVKCLSIVVLVLFSQYVIMMVCGVIMYKKTSGNLTSTSDHLEKIQKQFFTALVYQVTAPTLLVQLPALLVLCAPLLDMKISLNSRIIIYGFSAYPLIDTLIIFRVITAYQNAYKKFITWLIKDIREMIDGPTPVNGPPSLVANADRTVN